MSRLPVDRRAPISVPLPRWLRWPALALAIAVASYFVAGFHFALRPGAPEWLALGTWSMFTTLDRHHLAVEADARVDGAWRPLDLPALFPYRWESGHRYQRKSIRRDGTNLRKFAGAACGRAGPEVQAIRLREVRWRHTIGSFDQPRRGAKFHELGEFPCPGAP
jgi:hypothetical protein